MPDASSLDPMQPQPPDDELELVAWWFQSQTELIERMGRVIRQSYDEIIDTARTGRWDFESCEPQELGYMGVKIEHVLRGAYQFDYGERMDYRVAGVDVDCKWSKNFGGWQIPPEAVGHLCLLLWGDEQSCEMAVGLLRTTANILVGGNRDGKKTIQSPGGRQRIRWLIPTGPYLPPNFLLHLPAGDRDAILSHKGGDARAAELFRRCEGIIIKRHTIESIGQQKDEARRFRGETRARMLAQGFEILNGHWLKDRLRAAELGGPVPIGSQEWICLRSDGSTPARLAARLSQASS